MTKQEEKAPRALKLLALFKEFATPKYAWLAFGLAVVLATSAFGGMAATPIPAPTSARAPVSIKADPLVLDIEPGQLTGTEPGFPTPSKVRRFVLVRLTVTNTSDRVVSSLTLRSALRLTGAKVLDRSTGGLAPEAAPELSRVEGGTVSNLQPGVPTAVIAYWAQPLSEPAPRGGSLKVRSHTWRADSIIGGMFWADPALSATVTLPLEGAG